MVYKPKPLKPYTPKPLKPYTPKPLKDYTPVPLKPYTPKPLKDYTPVPLKPYTPKPLKDYTPVPLKPYTPKPIKPYVPKPTKPYIPKPVRQHPSVKAKEAGPGIEICPYCSEGFKVPDHLTHGKAFLCPHCKSRIHYVEERVDRDPGDKDLQVLMAIRDAGNESSMTEVCQMLGADYNRIRNICRSLGDADYLDLFLSGACRMTSKGRRYLERKEGV